MHTVITGGSSGIGLALASLLLQRGQRASLVARDYSALEAARNRLVETGLPADNIAIASCDVTDQASVGRSIETCMSSLGGVDALIASAGIVDPELFAVQSAEDFDRQIATNLNGVANSIRAVYPQMVKTGRGSIMIVGSGAGLVGIPGYAAYCASKFALRGLSASLAMEAQAHGVRIGICFPPDTQTPQFESEMAARPAEARLFLGPPKPWPVDAVAIRILRGMDAGKGETFFGIKLALLAHLQPIIVPALYHHYTTRIRAIKDVDRAYP